ncbi:MAG: hypothetical protein HQL07_02230 [Nitrospirae bacterium]|nr:hypothetical protein [Magnetococcales bacterium]HAT51023.1 hypothetical protein [Alphaproteobacteria bacterium]
MWTDPIVEEVRKNREAFSAQFNFDMRAMVKALQEMEKESGRKLVSFAPNALKENPERVEEFSQQGNSIGNRLDPP